MMWYEKDDILMGVLNSYDLSSLASAQGPQGNERTGTVPFIFSLRKVKEAKSSICIVMISNRSYGFSSGFVCVTRTGTSQRSSALSMNEQLTMLRTVARRSTIF